jgi:hypothetical protein
MFLLVMLVMLPLHSLHCGKYKLAFALDVAGLLLLTCTPVVEYIFNLNISYVVEGVLVGNLVSVIGLHANKT